MERGRKEEQKEGKKERKGKERVLKSGREGLRGHNNLASFYE